MNEFTIRYDGEDHHWVSPDALMLRSVLDLIIRMKIAPAWDVAKNVVTGAKKAIDVGACIGSITYLIRELAPDIEVHAYEPTKENYACLVENVGGLPDVYCYNHGLSNKEQDMTIAMPTVEQKRYMNYFKEDNVGIMSVYGKSEYRKQPIHVKVLDDLHDKADIIKVDAEGHDYQIMLGARNLIMNSRPFLMLELLPANFTLSGNTLGDYLDLLFKQYKYVPVGGDWGISFWVPEERAPEPFRSARFRFEEVDNKFTSGYKIIVMGDK